jgi:hypothetical protein
VGTGRRRGSGRYEEQRGHPERGYPERGQCVLASDHDDLPGRRQPATIGRLRLMSTDRMSTSLAYKSPLGNKVPLAGRLLSTAAKCLSQRRTGSRSPAHAAEEDRLSAEPHGGTAMAGGVGHPNTGSVAHAPRRASWLARCLERVNNHLEPTHSSAGRACDRAELSALRLGRGGAVARPSSSRTLDPKRRLPNQTSRSAHSP